MARPSPAVARVVGVLDFLADHPEDAYTLSELCRQVGVNKATAHALLAELTEAGYLVRDPVHKTYALGPRLLAVGAAAGRSDRTTLNRARPHMRRLATELDVRCVASTLRGDEIVVLEVAGRDRPFRVSVQPGHRAPCAPPIGTVFMAWAGDRAVERWLARAGGELPAEARTRYLEALAVVRRRGCSLSLDGSAPARIEQAMIGTQTFYEAVLDLGQEAYLLDDLGPDRTYALSHLAVPVFGPEGRVVLALTVYDLPDFLSAAEVEALAARARAAAAAVTEAVGGAAPRPHQEAP